MTNLGALAEVAHSRRRRRQVRDRRRGRVGSGGIRSFGRRHVAVLAASVLVATGTPAKANEPDPQVRIARLFAKAVWPEEVGLSHDVVHTRCRQSRDQCRVVIGHIGGATAGSWRTLAGSGKQPDNYHWHYDRDEPYAICEGRSCFYRGTLRIQYQQSLNGYQMRYAQSVQSDHQMQDPFRIRANHIQCRRDRRRDSNCNQSPNPPPERNWHTHLRQPARFTIDAVDRHDSKKFLNLRHDFELDIDGLPTVNVTGTDTSYRWRCNSRWVDKCRYDGPS